MRCDYGIGIVGSGWVEVLSQAGISPMGWVITGKRTDLTLPPILVIAYILLTYLILAVIVLIWDLIIFVKLWLVVSLIIISLLGISLLGILLLGIWLVLTLPIKCIGCSIKVLWVERLVNRGNAIVIATILNGRIWH